jgi:glycosyltransferase involved in cell wall biosynthesis
MPKVTALLHTRNDAARISRALESLRPCDELLIIDHGSKDDTVPLARSHGARIKQAVTGVEDGTYVVDARHDWVLCLQPTESLAESLEASLLEWKGQDIPFDARGFRVTIREETEQGWRILQPEMRLVNRTCLNWTTTLPPDDPTVEQLEGELLRFLHP